MTVPNNRVTFGAIKGTHHQRSEHDHFGTLSLVKAPNGTLHLFCLCDNGGPNAFDEWEVVRECATAEDIEQFGRNSKTSRDEEKARKEWEETKKKWENEHKTSLDSLAQNNAT